MEASKSVYDGLSREQLVELLTMDARNWLAMDGVWFQSVEGKFGMDEAMIHDTEAWRRFTGIEARRIRQFLNLPEYPGLDGLEKALPLRLAARTNRHEILRRDGALIYRVLDCRVQSARKRKGMELHPCKSVGCVEYEGFAKTIDSRIACHCLSCYPEITDDSCACGWVFTLEDA